MIAQPRNWRGAELVLAVAPSGDLRSDLPAGLLARRLLVGRIEATDVVNDCEGGGRGKQNGGDRGCVSGNQSGHVGPFLRRRWSRVRQPACPARRSHDVTNRTRMRLISARDISLFPEPREIFPMVRRNFRRGTD